jgi:hypothetical protein
VGAAFESLAKVNEASCSNVSSIIPLQGGSFTKVVSLSERKASEAFRAAHNRAEDNKPLYLDHPQYERFEVRQTDGKTAE